MLPSQVELIQSSFAKVAPISETAAGLFYGRLFEIAPEVKPMFKGDMREQGRKLMATLAVVVKGLSNLEAVVPAAQVLAKRHVAYGVKDAHYAPVGAALLWTLEQGLGPDFTPEVKAAWAEAYGILSSVMIAAAAEAAPTTAAAE
ncbi:globin family protein [Aquabacter cavernae]|uniref:globin family protein n=1 Tax=Aquabacter cavernae TaxID=2496029 RepID=UPI000F8CB801|nr:globin family protein [Aquabacter cavernae]